MSGGGGGGGGGGSRREEEEEGGGDWLDDDGLTKMLFLGGPSLSYSAVEFLPMSNLTIMAAAEGRDDATGARGRGAS